MSREKLDFWVLIKKLIVLRDLEDVILDKLPDEELVERHEQGRFMLEALDGEVKMIRDIFGDRLDKEHVDGKLVGDFNVGRRKMRKLPDFSLERAKEFGAVKETVDATMLRKIHKTTPIKGAEEVSYVTITQVKPKEEAA